MHTPNANALTSLACPCEGSAHSNEGNLETGGEGRLYVYGYRVQLVQSPAYVGADHRVSIERFTHTGTYPRSGGLATRTRPSSQEPLDRKKWVLRSTLAPENLAAGLFTSGISTWRA